jgi:6-phosphogluconolactonase (cycloisomerase 2 family)
MHAYVGNWSVKPAQRGLSIYSYNSETGELTLKETIHEEYSIADQCIDRESGKLYVCDESVVRRGNIDSGLIKVFSVTEDGLHEDEGETPTILTKPSGICIDHSRKYVLVAHYGGRSHVGKLVKNEDGTITATTVCDDAGIALYRLNSDGSVGELLDVVLTPKTAPSDPYAASHEHCVVEAPCGDFFMVCDKGLDRIYSVALNRDTEKLEILTETHVGKGYMPRYAQFIPNTNVVVESNEGRPVLHVYEYNNKTGELTLKQAVTLTEQEGKFVQCSDMALSADGKILYASVREANIIVTLQVSEDGTLTPIDTVNCGGDNPRGLCIAPDGRFLICTGIDSGTITTFSIGEDGKLTNTGKTVSAILPSTVTIA